MFALVALLLTAFVLATLKKWAKPAAKPYKAPRLPAFGALVLSLLAFGLLLTSWICWIVLAETPCRAAGTAWNPFQGYSYSFILMCMASGFALIATCLMGLGAAKISVPPPATPLLTAKELPPASIHTQTAYTYPEVYVEPPSPPLAYPAYPYTPAPSATPVAPPPSHREVTLGSVLNG